MEAKTTDVSTGLLDCHINAMWTRKCLSAASAARAWLCNRNASRICRLARLRSVA